MIRPLGLVLDQQDDWLRSYDDVDVSHWQSKEIRTPVVEFEIARHNKGR